MAAPTFVLGEKRAEVKAANPDDKIGDIAKKMGKMWQELDEKAKVGHFFSCVNLALLQAPYEKKAEAAKKKYADEMAAYEG